MQAANDTPGPDEAKTRASVDPRETYGDPMSLELLPKETAYELEVVPLWCVERQLTVAMADPFNVIALDQVRALFGGDVEVRTLVAGEAELSKAIDQFYGFELSVDGILHEVETGEVEPGLLVEVLEVARRQGVRLFHSSLTRLRVLPGRRLSSP